MEQTELQQAYEEFRDDLLLEAEASAEPDRRAFFRMYADLASENGDCIDLEYTPARREGRNGYQVDGYALDLDRKELYLAVCDFRQDTSLEVLNAAQIEDCMKRARRFVELAFDPEFINQLEDESPAAKAAYPIFTQPASIRRIRFILFSNARLSTRKAPEAAGEIAGRPAVYNYFDFRRYVDIQNSRGAPEPIEIDFAELGVEPLPCLAASGGNTSYASYLAALPGELLARIYGLYGARLLEQNVRTFLQARTKVNRGIIETAKDAPERFFAYNNGITATASAIRTTSAPGGVVSIEAISDLQIVNGGQTTASILYAKDQRDADLSEVFVQMKLTVVRPDLVEDLVPRISRYANTQNKINEADFFSSHPFHVTMEQYSRRISAPLKPGSQTSSKWFYERARGQYKDASAYGSVADKRKFALEFPKAQVFDKTDLAKYQMTFERKPNIVSQHGTKCFLAFADDVARQWELAPVAFNEEWFKRAVAQAILFRWTDQMVGRSEWYKLDRGWKSQTVTYTLAWLEHEIRRRGKAGLNMQIIWNDQEVPEELQQAITALAPQMAAAISNTPPNVKNVGEYCKQQACWASIAKMEFDLQELPDALLLEHDDARQAARDAAGVRRMDLEIELDTILFTLVPKAESIKAKAQRMRILSPKCATALDKLAKGRLNLIKSEKEALKHLFARFAQSGIDPTQL